MTFAEDNKSTFSSTDTDSKRLRANSQITPTAGELTVNLHLSTSQSFVTFCELVNAKSQGFKIFFSFHQTVLYSLISYQKLNPGNIDTEDRQEVHVKVNI